MKRNIIIILLLFLFSCKKENKSNTIDFSLLDKYNWQMVIASNEKSPFDSNQNIPYSDTFLYSFSKQNYVEKYQITTTGYILSSDAPPTVSINKNRYEKDGTYNANSNDSTIFFNGSYHTLCSDRMSFKYRDTIINFSYKIKIIELSRFKMTCKFVTAPSGALFNSFDNVFVQKMPEPRLFYLPSFTYIAIEK